MLKDTRTTYNLALGHLLKMNTHKKSAADLNMATIEAELQKMFVTKKGVRALHKRHHKLLRTPKVPRQQAVKAVLAVFKAHHTREKKRLSQVPVAFKTCPRFQPGFKTKKIKTSDSIEKRSITVVNDSFVHPDEVWPYSKAPAWYECTFFVRLQGAFPSREVILPFRQKPGVHIYSPEGTVARRKCKM